MPPLRDGAHLMSATANPGAATPTDHRRHPCTILNRGFAFVRSLRHASSIHAVGSVETAACRLLATLARPQAKANQKREERNK